MATGAAIGVGIGAAAAGTAAAVRAQRMKTDPRKQTYGGSADAQDVMLGQYENQDSNSQVNQAYGINNLRQGGQMGSALNRQGSIMMGQQYDAGPVSTQGMSLLNAYQPGQVAATQQQAALDQGSLNNLGAARSGGALGLRNALNANAGGNVQAAQNAAMMRAQEQQSLLGAQVGQANADRTQQFQQQQAAIQNTQNIQQLGANVAGAGAGIYNGVAGQVANIGLNQMQQAQGAQMHVYDQQNQDNMAIEMARQQNQARKSNNLWGMAGQMFGIAGKAAGSMGGGSAG